jgi:hypothetical protein
MSGGFIGGKRFDEHVREMFKKFNVGVSFARFNPQMKEGH